MLLRVRYMCWQAEWWPHSKFSSDIYMYRVSSKMWNLQIQISSQAGNWCHLEKRLGVLLLLVGRDHHLPDVHGELQLRCPGEQHLVNIFPVFPIFYKSNSTAETSTILSSLSVSVIICRCSTRHNLPVHGGCQILESLYEPLRDLFYFIQDLIGSIGGYLRLFLGWSVMSIVTAAPVWCTLLSPVFCKKNIDNWIKAKSCRSPSKLVLTMYFPCHWVRHRRRRFSSRWLLNNWFSLTWRTAGVCSLMTNTKFPELFWVLCQVPIEAKYKKQVHKNKTRMSEWVNIVVACYISCFICHKMMLCFVYTK